MDQLHSLKKGGPGIPQPLFDYRPLYIIGPVAFAATIALTSTTISCVLVSTVIIGSLLGVGYILYPVDPFESNEASKEGTVLSESLSFDKQTRLAQQFEFNYSAHLVPLPPPVWLVIASFIATVLSRGARIESYPGFKETIRVQNNKWKLLENSWSVFNSNCELVHVQLMRFKHTMRARVTVVSFAHGILTWETKAPLTTLTQPQGKESKKCSVGAASVPSNQIQLGGLNVEYNEQERRWKLRFSGSMAHFTRLGKQTLSDSLTPTIQAPQFDQSVHCELDMCVDSKSDPVTGWVGGGSLWLQTKHLSVASSGREVLPQMFNAIRSYCTPSDQDVALRSPNDSFVSATNCQATVRVFRRRVGSPRVLLKPVLEFSTRSMHVLRAGRFIPKPNENWLSSITSVLNDKSHAISRQYDKCTIGLLSMTPTKPLPPLWVIEHAGADQTARLMNRNTANEMTDSTTSSNSEKYTNTQEMPKVCLVRIEMTERPDCRGYMMQGWVHIIGDESWKSHAVNSFSLPGESERATVEGSPAESPQHMPSSVDSQESFVHEIALASYIISQPIRLANGLRHELILEDCSQQFWKLIVDPICDNNFLIPNLDSTSTLSHRYVFADITLQLDGKSFGSFRSVLHCFRPADETQPQPIQTSAA